MGVLCYNFKFLIGDIEVYVTKVFTVQQGANQMVKITLFFL